MVLVSVLILFGFLLGVIVVVAAEFLGFLWILKRLRRKFDSDKAKISSITQQLDRSASSQFDSHHSFKKEVTFCSFTKYPFFIYSILCEC